MKFLGHECKFNTFFFFRLAKLEFAEIKNTKLLLKTKHADFNIYFFVNFPYDSNGNIKTVTVTDL